jgi:hypothetical protein
MSLHKGSGGSYRVIGIVVLKFVSDSFKFIHKVDVEDSIVNVPFVILQSKNTNSAKNAVRVKQLIRDL